MGRKGEATREQIRVAARELFERDGYTRVTMQEICDACGLSKGGLYRHYQDKAHVFTEILREEQRLEDDCEQAQRGEDVPAQTILADFWERLRGDLRSAPGLQMAIYEYCAENREGQGPGLMAKQYARGEAILLSLIDYGTRRGEFHVGDPRGAAAAILFLTEGLRMAGLVMPVTEELLAGVFGQVRAMMGAADREE